MSCFMMSFKEADIQELASHEHEVLGSDFCSGYTDVFGKWNTGFECPRMGNGETVYCCGTVTYKYCCTRRDQQSVGISQSVMLGSVLGSVLMIILVALVSCLICRRCIPYRRAHPSLSGGPLYSMHCSSTASGMANMYSFSGQNTAVTTPLDTPHILMDLDGAEHIYAQLNHQRGLGRQLLRNGLDPHPSEPPPPYNEQAPDSDSNVDSQHRTTSFVTQASCEGTISSGHRNGLANQRPTGNDVIAGPQANLYWSTKF